MLTLLSKTPACKVFASLFLAVFIFQGHASSQTNTWTSGGPFGGNVQQVLVNPNSATTLFVITEHRVYKSTSSGSSWSLSGNGLTGSVFRLAIDTANANNLYAATSAGLFKSSDGGSTWSA